MHASHKVGFFLPPSGLQTSPCWTGSEERKGSTPGQSELYRGGYDHQPENQVGPTILSLKIWLETLDKTKRNNKRKRNCIFCWLLGQKHVAMGLEAAAFLPDENLSGNEAERESRTILPATFLGSWIKPCLELCLPVTIFSL